MRESEFKPKMIALHYFSVRDDTMGKAFKFRKDKKGRWYLPQFNTSSTSFDILFSDAVKAFGPPRTYRL